MPKKKPEPPALPDNDPKTLRVTAQAANEAKAETLARTALRPTVQAGITLVDYNKHLGELSITTLVEDLGKQCELVSKGDLSRVEALLMAQAHTLDAIFHRLARRAERCEMLNQFEANLRMALKAQSQCRATLDTLAEMKQPRPVAFVKQANIANGPQQVNNGPAPQPSDTSRAGENKNRQSKLLEHDHGERLDTRTARAASSAGTEMETVGAVNRPADSER
jgi:hypothetical protein